MITSNLVFGLGLFIYMFIYLVDIKTARNAWFIFFYAYFLCVIALTLFPMPSNINKNYEMRIDNRRPFTTIVYMLDYYPTFYLIKNVIGNILMFVPFGYIYTYISKRKVKFINVSMYCTMFSIFIESMQFLLCFILKVNYRVIDVDDIILNTIGGMLGYLLFKVENKVYRRLKNNFINRKNIIKNKLERYIENV